MGIIALRGMVPEQDDTCNNLITKRVDADEAGGMLVIPAAFLGTANALAPVMGGAVFQAVGSAMPFLLGGIRKDSFLIE